MAHREHGASRTWRITNMAHHEHGASRTWCITNMAHHEHGASRTWCVERCPEGALANSRWEASGFMLAHPPDQRVPNPAPAGAAPCLLPSHRSIRERRSVSRAEGNESRGRVLSSAPQFATSFLSDAQVAQLVEQRTENPRVGGSIPSLGTTHNPRSHLLS